MHMQNTPGTQARALIANDKPLPPSPRTPRLRRPSSAHRKRVVITKSIEILASEWDAQKAVADARKDPGGTVVAALPLGQTTPVTYIAAPQVRRGNEHVQKGISMARQLYNNVGKFIPRPKGESP